MPHDSVRDREIAVNSAKITPEKTGKYSRPRFSCTAPPNKKARRAGFQASNIYRLLVIWHSSVPFSGRDDLAVETGIPGAAATGHALQAATV